MPITVSCPSCNTTLKAPDAAAGRKVKCPKCATPFDVPATAAVTAPAPPRPPAAPPPGDGDEGRPRRRREVEDEYEEDEFARRQPAAQGSNTGAQFGLGVAALAVGAIGLVFAFIPCLGWIIAVPAGIIGLILGVVGLIIGLTKGKQGLAFPIAGASVSFASIVVSLIWWLWFVHGVRSTAQQFEQAVKDAQQRQKQGGNPPPGIGGNVILTKNDQLTATDPFDKARAGSKCKTYTVNLQAGKTYQIDMVSGAVDSYLRLENPAGQEVAHDDDSGGFPNARIRYTCAQGGDYRIIATTFVGGTGPFTLTVREQ